MTDEAYREYLISRLRKEQKALVALLHGDVKATYCGICYNAQLVVWETLAHTVIVRNGFRKSLMQAFHDLEDIMKQWPHYAGNVVYPVPAPAINDPSNIWTGLQGAYRRSLCLFLLEQIRNAIGD